VARRARQDNYTDAGFVGFTAHMSNAVWSAIRRAKDSMTKSRAAARLSGQRFRRPLARYMQSARRADCAPFPQPTQRYTYLPSAGQVPSRAAVAATGSAGGTATAQRQMATSGQRRCVRDHRGGGGGGGTARSNGGNAVDPRATSRSRAAYASPPQAAQQARTTPRGQRTTSPRRRWASVH